MYVKHRVMLVLVGILMIQSACTSSAGGCPKSTMDTDLLTNSADGYCLLYPTKYSTEIPGYIVINPANATADTPGEAWVSIEVVPAGEQTADQAADAQISAAGPGFNINRKNVKLGGERGVVVDGLPGPDPWRKVFVVHNGRLYTLTFQPWVAGTAGAGQQTSLESLYTVVMESFHFLPPGGSQ